MPAYVRKHIYHDCLECQDPTYCRNGNDGCNEGIFYGGGPSLVVVDETMKQLHASISRGVGKLGLVLTDDEYHQRDWISFIF